MNDYTVLSPSELRVLVLAAQGLTARQIAEDLHRSRDTISAQLGQARTKLGAKTTSHAVALAFRQGLIE